MKIKTIIKKIFSLLVYIFAMTGFVLVAGFFAVRMNLTNVSGKVDNHNKDFQRNDAEIKKIQEVKGEETAKEENMTIADVSQEIEKLSKIKEIRQKNYCKIEVVGNTYPFNARKIVEIAEQTKLDAIMTKAIMAVELRMKDDAAFQTRISQCDNAVSKVEDFEDIKKRFGSAEGQNAFSWINDPEWQAIKAATAKDKDVIDKAAIQAGIEPRLIVSNMIVEQLRLFHSEREVFKKFFEPLKILCSANKISLGVMGIKEATAIKIENNLKDPASEYYLGKEYENMLDFETNDVASERYDRLTDEKNHYYSYLYGALYLKQMMKQWENTGYNITYRPEIIGTLFNVGFPQSRPNPDPKVGGSHITIDGKEYSFGSLAYEFYYSGEMLQEFPYDTK